MKEIWKPVRNYEGLYEVSNLGRVKSLERTVWCGLNGGCYRTVSEKILKAYDNGHGYLKVELCKDGKVEQPLVHRLVASAFLDNVDNLPQVNHKDENPKNNMVENLEYCSRQYNVEYSQGKAVIGINKESGLILEFPSQKEASRQTGINQGHICDCLKGRRKSAGGFYWHYVESEEVM